MDLEDKYWEWDRRKQRALYRKVGKTPPDDGEPGDRLTEMLQEEPIKRKDIDRD